MISAEVTRLQEILLKEGPGQISTLEIGHLLIQMLLKTPSVILVIGFLFSMLLPALLTLIAASLVNLPYRGYLTAYMAVSITTLIELTLEIVLSVYNIEGWAIWFGIHCIVALFVYAFCYRTTFMKSFLIILFDAVLRSILAFLGLLLL